MQVISVSPAANSTGRPLEQNIQVTFDREIDQSTVDAGSFVVSQKTMVGIQDLIVEDTVTATTTVDGAFSFSVANNQTTVTFNPTKPLEANAEYTVILSTDILGLDASALDSIHKWKFTTGSGAVVEPPSATSDVADVPYRSTPVTPLTGGLDTYLSLLSAIPADQASSLPLTTSSITLTFNKTINDSLFSSSSFSLTAEPVDGNPNTPSSGTLQAAAAVVDGTKLRFSLNLTATPLLANNLVILTINSLTATDGSELAAPLVYFFTTTYSPLYSTGRLIRSRIGSYIANISDDTVNLAIYAASLEADQLVPQLEDTSTVSDAFLNQVAYAKARYAQVTACLTLLLNSDNFGFRKKGKLIGDMEVSWEQSRILEKLYDNLVKEQADLADELENLGRPYLAPQSTIKGELDWDRPVVGRDFDSDPYTAPAANTDVVPLFSRRRLKVWAAWPLTPRRVI